MTSARRNAAAAARLSALARRTARRLPPRAQDVLRTGVRAARDRTRPPHGAPGRRGPSPTPHADPVAAADFFAAASAQLRTVAGSGPVVGMFLDQLEAARADGRTVAALSRHAWTTDQLPLRDLACAAALDLLADGRPALADWLAQQILATDPDIGTAHEVRAIVAIEHGRAQEARQHRARVTDTDPAGDEVGRWLKRQRARMAARAVFTDLGRAAVTEPAADAADPAQLWQDAVREPDRTLSALLQARAVAAASRPASGYDAGLWRRRYLLDRLDEPRGVVALRARLDAEEAAVRAMSAGDGSWAHEVPVQPAGAAARKHDRAVVVRVADEQAERDLADVLGRLARTRNGSELVVLHDGLDPVTVAAVTAVAPGVRFVASRARHGVAGAVIASVQRELADTVELVGVDGPQTGRPADADLLARGNALLDAVDSLAAAELFEREVHQPHQLTDRVLLRWQLALHRSSRYEQALDLLAVCDARVAAATAGANTAWVVRDRTRGAAFVEQLKQRRPDDSRIGGLSARFRAAEPRLPATGRALVHVAAYIGRGGNYGDRVLPLAVRQAVSSVSAAPLEFVPVQAHQLFDETRRELADRSAGVIVGGGGLFLPDTAPNGNSGWQWNVPAEQLRRIEAPLAVVAVGFNLFRGQSFSGGLFVENLTQLVDRADVVGLRNHGSIREVRTLLPAHLAAKIEYLPCPTTVLAHLYPELANRLPRRRSVLINAAYDRSGLRFGSGYGTFLAQLARYVKALRRADVEVEIVSHMAPDERLAADLRADYALDLPLRRLNEVPLEEAYRTYREAGVVVGMRGHATMIPFGLRTPVLSLVSHPKMRYFLDDIAHPEWGFEVSDPFRRGLLERTLHVLAEPAGYVADIVAAQQVLLESVQGPLRRFVGEQVGARA